MVGNFLWFFPWNPRPLTFFSRSNQRFKPKENHAKYSIFRTHLIVFLKIILNVFFNQLVRSFEREDFKRTHEVRVNRRQNDFWGFFKKKFNFFFNFFFFLNFLFFFPENYFFEKYWNPKCSSFTNGFVVLLIQGEAIFHFKVR